MGFISVRGARTHNLKNIDIDLPRDRLVVITGLSGSGKSSLAFDTIYAEGQRRYVESLSAYARQFLSLMEKPDVDLIEGLSPAISIEQKAASHNPRSTVGTVTEIYDYLRLLYARVGEPRCPDHGTVLKAQTISQMVDQTLALPDGSRIVMMARMIDGRKGEFSNLLSDLKRRGFLRARLDGEFVELEDIDRLDRHHKHNLDVVVDRVIVRDRNRQRVAESFETAIALSEGTARIAVLPGRDTGAGDAAPASEPATSEDLVFSANHACSVCGFSMSKLEPRMFSFNNPRGACATCSGLGVRQYFDPAKVVREPELSLAAGAITGWDRRNPYYFSMLTALSEFYEFNLDAAFEDLPDEIQKVILYGSGRVSIRFRYAGIGGRQRIKDHPFEGVINNFERRYKGTESNSVREDLSRFISNKACAVCGGTRLKNEARNVFVADRAIHAITSLPLDACSAFFETLALDDQRAAIAEKITTEITQRLKFLINVGLDYLSLDRAADTLSGGESQRIRLASQIGSKLVGVTYILDEPSIGLHPRDNGRLLDTLFALRDLGNSVIVVEHDEEAIRNADYVVDLGPMAGNAGGEVVASGTPEEIIAHPDSLTGSYLRREKSIGLPAMRHTPQPNRAISISGASGNNLKNIDVEIPLGVFTCITGVSGSGKSTLINDTLYPAVANALRRHRTTALGRGAVDGVEHIDKIIDIDQSPIGRTPRSNPATYTGMFTTIRELFASTPEARARGYKPGRFSFNVRGGRCEACQGDGLLKVEMHFLADVYVPCDSCLGSRYNRETLDIRYKGKNIHQVLGMTVDEACGFLRAIPSVARKLDTLADVGLGYVHIGQSATTLSGGEAQRIKLARELAKRDTGKTLYILDEPTTGLHFHDIKQLLNVLHSLRDKGNTVVVIEHNLDVIKTADWVIDLGPEGGDRGGRIVAQGTPETIAADSGSYTGQFIKQTLENQLPLAKVQHR